MKITCNSRAIAGSSRNAVDKPTLFKQLKLIEKLLFEISYFVILVRYYFQSKKRRWIDHQIVVSCSKQQLCHVVRSDVDQSVSALISIDRAAMMSLFCSLLCRLLPCLMRARHRAAPVFVRLVVGSLTSIEFTPAAVSKRRRKQPDNGDGDAHEATSIDER
jgi:hypothetical protein